MGRSVGRSPRPPHPFLPVPYLCEVAVTALTFGFAPPGTATAAVKINLWWLSHHIFFIGWKALCADWAC